MISLINDYIIATNEDYSSLIIRRGSELLEENSYLLDTPKLVLDWALQYHEVLIEQLNESIEKFIYH